jgi:DNA polymerase
VYCDLASQVFGRPIAPDDKTERQVGKHAVLGCGYGMGADRFAKQAADQGVDLKSAGITAELVVEGYRDAYPAIAGAKMDGRGISWRQGGVWRDVEEAAQRTVLSGRTQQAARCCFGHDGCSLVIALPSGRRMYFRNARVEKRVPGYCKSLGIAPVWKPVIVFDDPKEGAVATYGGALVENIVQAICRDLLVAAMLTCERQGLPVVLHVHDELVLEVPAHDADAATQELVAIMSTPPVWAAGFPIEVDGFSAERYFKVPPPGTHAVKARNGTIVA